MKRSGAFRAAVLPLIAVAGAGALTFFGLRAANGDSGAQTHPWTHPHVLTISDGSDVSTLNPHLSQFASTANLSEMTMAWLVRWDEHNVEYPELATAVPTRANGGVSADGRTITYHLRRGVRWSDGAPFDADDVLFSVRVVNDPANHEGARFDQIASAKAPDKYTVVFHLKAPYAPATASFFSSCCANASILPRHLLARYRTINNVPYNALPVGIGPFKFARWDRGKQVVLVANPLYWRGRPKLDEVVYAIVPDHDALLARMRAHSVDLWYQFGGAYRERIRSVPGVAILRQPSYAYEHIDFNLQHAQVADRRVREALRLAFDRTALVAHVERGAAAVRDAAVPLSAPYTVDLGTTQYDPQKADALLDQAGWHRAADGVRAKDGVRLELRIAERSGAADADAMIGRLRDDWRRVGVATSVQRYAPAQMFAPAAEGGVVYGSSWDVVAFVWAADPLGDYSSIYGCDAFPPNGENNLRWCNAAADRAMHALFGHYDQAERAGDVATLMRAFVADVPSIVAFLREDMFAYNNDLKGYHPNSLTPFDNMMDVDI